MASLAAECLERASEEGMDVPEIDSTLLMELLDESHLEEPEDDRLGCVMRSLEAEINPAAAATAAAAGGIMAVESIHAHEECEDCGLDDILSDLDSHDCSGSPSAYLIDDPFDLVEMEVVAAGSPSGGDMGGWYVDEGGMVGYGDVRESSFYFYGESSMEQAYSPLWE